MSEYDILNVPHNASDEDIKKAYKKLALKHHPDREGGDTEMFKKISNAYETLSDPEKRYPYKSCLPPKQYESTVTISLEDAFKGATKNLRVTRQTPCRSCGGHGVLAQQYQMGPFTQTMRQMCPRCAGQGSLQGPAEELMVTLTIGAGTPDGIRYVHGDITFIVKVDMHPVFTRRGALLVWEKEITFEESVEGTVLQCPHFNGNLQIDTAPWGVIDPRKEYQFGDLVTKFTIKYPEPSARYTVHFKKIVADPEL